MWFIKDDRYDGLLDKIVKLTTTVSAMNERLAQLERDFVSMNSTEDGAEKFDKLMRTKEGLLSYKKLRGRSVTEDDNRD